jgi:electron transport complex protein RnfC
MGLITNRLGLKIEGHKSLTKNLVIEKITDLKVIGKLYIPKIYAVGRELTFEVAIGDRVKVGQKLAYGGPFYVPVFSPVSGKIIAEELRYSASLNRPVSHLVIENDGKYTKDTKLPIINFESATREEIVEHIKNAGIIGLGGAGFPTFVKYDKVKGLETLIINTVECEPYLTTDYHGVNSNMDSFVKGIQLLKRAADAKQVIVAIKKGKAELTNKIKQAVKSFDYIQVKEVPDLYPMGWERTLIKSIVKKEYKRLPSEIGIVVNNATTAIAVGEALTKGNPIFSRIISVSGNGIKKPGLIEVPIFTIAQNIINHLGGYSEDNVVLLAGGPMTSKAQMNDSFALERHHGALTIVKHVETTASACSRCGKCTLNCPAGLQPVEIKIAMENKDLKRLEELKASDCVECGLCSYVCPSKIDVTEAVRKGKMQLKINEQLKAVKK